MSYFLAGEKRVMIFLFFESWLLLLFDTIVLAIGRRKKNLE